MNINAKSNLVNVILIVVIFLLLLWLAPKRYHTVRGLVLPKAKPMAVIPANEVTFLQSPPTARYDRLGYINLEQFYNPKTQSLDEQAVLDRARVLAAGMGANGVIIKSFGHSLGTIPALSIFQFQGVAIHEF